jgi:hypothetical protein
MKIWGSAEPVDKSAIPEANETTSPMNMKRQRGRNNGRNKPHMPHMPNRGQQTFDSNGPEVRIRGNAYQVLEKYLAMARDATAAGDRIAAENFYQHAEHYYRVINANNEHHRGQHMQGQNPQQQQHNQQPQQQHGQQHDPRGGMPHDGGQQMVDPGAGPQPLTGGPQGQGGDGHQS